MADKTPRVTIDLLNGNDEDMAAAYRAIGEEMTMVLVPTEEWEDSKNDD